MTQIDVLKMAIEAGLAAETSDGRHQIWYPDNLHHFANLVAAKEREEANARANASWTLMCKKMVDIEREACAKDAEWCIQNHLEHLMPERIRARKETI